MKKSRLLQHEDDDPSKPLLKDGNDFVSETSPLDADLAFQVHDYDAAHGDRDLLVRPMAYDNFSRNLLSLHKYGIVFFPTSKGFWKDANEALNPSVPEAGRAVDQPIQCPLNNAALAILNKVPKPSLK